MATIVAFHAHPDDEVLLTGGTIACLAAEDHRVIIVVATDGEMWPDQHRGQRLAALRASAAILGAGNAVHLGYADSGHGGSRPAGGTRFARAELRRPRESSLGLLTAARRPAAQLRPARRLRPSRPCRVHQVGARAAELAGVRVVEATVPRELVARFARPLLLRLVTRHGLDEMARVRHAAVRDHAPGRRPLYAAQKRAPRPPALRSALAITGLAVRARRDIGSGDAVDQRSTVPDTQVTTPPPTQTVPSSSLLMCTSPRRPSAVPCRAR